MWGAKAHMQKLTGNTRLSTLKGYEPWKHNPNPRMLSAVGGRVGPRGRRQDLFDDFFRSTKQEFN